MAKRNCELCGYGLTMNARSCPHCRKRKRGKY